MDSTDQRPAGSAAGEDSARSARRLRAARTLAARLRAEGRHADAQVVGELCQSLSASRGTLRVLWRDNMALRARIRGRG